MAKAFVKVPIRPLRDIGLDERWLQERIAEDPGILGLGNLAVVERERTMAGGGRLDLLLADIGGKARYEVELMLGRLDESHIIRTIEYWDIERRRFPHLDHKAVIVAEDITSRFLNVIGLLNKSVPLVALQMTAMDLPEGVGLTFTRVLDLSESFEDGDEDGAETATQVSRGDWEEEGYADGMVVMDQILGMLKSTGVSPRVTYNQDHIAVGASGKNFLWFAPQKRSGKCLTEFLAGKDGVEALAAKLSTPSIGEASRRKATVKVLLNPEILTQNKALITEVLDASEKLAR